MAQKLSRAQRRKRGITLGRQTGCWVKYRLGLANITYRTVAAKAGLSENMVSQFLTGRKNSERVKTALAEILDFATFEQLVAASRGRGKGGAA